MGKPKLSKIDVRLVEESIKHWKRDVRAKLKKDIATQESLFALLWADNKKLVECYSESCPLCKIYYRDFEPEPCIACPYHKKYGISCTYIDGGHWKIFRKNPCLETCNGMIKALESILK